MSEAHKKWPLYFSIKEDIKQKIKDEVYKPGDMLPTENSLREEYSASRVTIRRAISELIEEGLVERGYGKTAQVACEMVPRSLNRLTGLKEELSSKGIKCSSFILDTQVVPADEAIAGEMDIPAGSEIYRIERLRYANGKPLCLQTMYIPCSLCPDFEPQKLVNTSFYEIVEKEYGLKISSAVQRIQATTINYRVAALLELSDLSASLLIERKTMLSTEACIEFSSSLYVGTRYSLSMTLKR